MAALDQCQEQRDQKGDHGQQAEFIERHVARPTTLGKINVTAASEIIPMGRFM
jgi:hypothetical protein